MTEGNPFNILLQDILSQDGSNGVFIGERHTSPSARQALTYLMPMLKAKGVRTLSLELRQSMVDDMAASASFEAWQKKLDGEYISGDYSPETVYQLVQAGKKYGIKLLGHEDPQPHDHYEQKLAEFYRAHFPQEVKLRDATLAAETDMKKRSGIIDTFHTTVRDGLKKDPTLDKKYAAIIAEYDSNTISPEGMDKRNRFAADYIKKHKAERKLLDKAEGKLLVLGGAAHSQIHNFQSILRGMAVGVTGLDEALHLQVINLEDLPPTSMPRKVGETEEILPGGGGYNVALPDNLAEYLKAHKITSWPPPGGVPYIEVPKDLPVKLPDKAADEPAPSRPPR